MKKFRVQLHGRNFLLNVNGEPGKFGFHAMRFVRAENPQEAEKIAIILVHQNPALRDLAMNESADRSVIEIEEIKEVGFLKFLKNKRANGLTFYSEDEG